MYSLLHILSCVYSLNGWESGTWPVTLNSDKSFWRYHRAYLPPSFNTIRWLVLMHFSACYVRGSLACSVLGPIQIVTMVSPGINQTQLLLYQSPSWRQCRQRGGKNDERRTKNATGNLSAPYNRHNVWPWAPAFDRSVQKKCKQLSLCSMLKYEPED
jgi:hypothetical protein